MSGFFFFVCVFGVVLFLFIYFIFILFFFLLLPATTTLKWFNACLFHQYLSFSNIVLNTGDRMAVTGRKV